ncbi:DUF2309 domain-containing protein [bacterium]|nr:DUF2309 domain-containing protein [bacterium]
MNQEHRLREIVTQLKRTLPAQAPLKDFIATNTLYAFQGLPFSKGLLEAQRKLGVRTYLTLSEYQKLFQSGRIKREVIEWLASNRKEEVLESLTNSESVVKSESEARSRLRDLWKKKYELDIITHVHPVFFRHLGHFLDQGISIAPMPFSDLGFWRALQEIEQTSKLSIFNRGKKGRAHSLLFESPWKALQEALKALVGSEDLFETYLFEMVQEHPGWSGLVSVIEGNPEHLNFVRKISLQEALAFELLLELDYVESFTKMNWAPLDSFQEEITKTSSTSSAQNESDQNLLQVLHSAWEWTYYRDLLTGLKANNQGTPTAPVESQVFFCIDDRCCSLRRHLEELDPAIETFGTPGFFGVEFWYKSEFDRFPVKLCPAPVTPGFLIRGTSPQGPGKRLLETDFLLSRLTHTLFGGWLISQTFGLLSAFRMILNVFVPSLSPKVATSFRHTDDRIQFKLLRGSESEQEKDLKLGFDRNEMADRVFGLLRSCGLTDNFSDLVVMLGHGSSTVNNPHYAAYDCGACSGRPGSINARIFCSMANDPEVRELVKKKGLIIPDTSVFVPALYDTTRDQVHFYDLSSVPETHKKKLKKLKHVLEDALLRTAKERSRRFEDIALDTPPLKARKALRKKSVSIFEPRQEFTHSGNAACIVGPRHLTRGLFLDRRCFLNSYDPKMDPEGGILANILKAAVPVCGGINLQYFFSRIDNEKMGSGTKLPHNVVGLISVANGTEGDLRPGLPQQMIEWHEPLRLMMFVYQEPQVALQAARKIAATYEWIQNEWVKYACLSPTTGDFYVYEAGEMKPYNFFGDAPGRVSSSMDLVSTTRDYLPVTLIGEHK